MMTYLSKVADCQSAVLLNRTPPKMCSCWFWELFRNSFTIENLRATVSSDVLFLLQRQVVRISCLRYCNIKHEVREVCRNKWCDVSSKFIIQSLFCLVNVSSSSTHFIPLVSFNTSWKHQKISGFIMFSGGIERNQWHEMS